MKTYRVGIVGFGMIGKVHAHAFASANFHAIDPPYRARVTHVATGHEDTAERARRMVDAEVATTDFREITENPETDIVVICTPNHLHLAPLLSAMERGKAIYCEKPIVHTWDEALKVRAALESYDGVARMVFHNRFYPATLRAKQLVDEGAIGEVLEFRACYMQGSHADPEMPMRWKASAAAGGGVIGDIASHAIDLVEHLVGPFAKLSAATHIGYAQRPDKHRPGETLPVDAEDCVAITARLPSGALGTIQATKLATGTENELAVEIFGTRGALRYDGMHPHQVLFYDATVGDKPNGGRRGWTAIDAGHRYDAPHDTFPGAKANVGWVRAHEASVVDFLDAVHQGRATQPDLARGVHIQHLLACVHESAEEERWIDV